MEFARAVKWDIDGVTGSVLPCIDPKVDVKKEKTFVYEVKWHFKLIEAIVWGREGYLDQDERKAAMAGIQTKLLMQPGVVNILVVSVLTPSSLATRRSTS